jgi:mRNA-degrading endonuclease RelE of RelBE toxin-antitoxin system
VELEKLNMSGIDDVYLISSVKKEFANAVNEMWKDNPPWQRYQKKLIQDLAVLEQERGMVFDLPQFEKLEDKNNLYCIRHPETKKNVRVIYTILDGNIILLVAFLEKNDGSYKKAIKTAKKRLVWLNAD